MAQNTLPKGWIKAPIKELCSLINGRAFKPSEWTESGLPIVRIQNLNNPAATYNYCDKKIDDKFHINKRELLFSWSGTPGTSFGAHIWEGKHALLNQHIFRILFNETLIDKKFFRIALNERLNSFISKAHGGVGLRHITKHNFEDTEILLPPFAEQKRIAEKVDSLLAHMKEISLKLDISFNLIKNIYQTILDSAVTGKLAEEWQPIRIKQVTKRIQYGYTASAKANVRGPKFLRITDIQDGKVNWQNVPSCQISEQNKKKYLLEKGDIVFARTGATTGKSFLITETKRSIFASYLIRLEPDISIIIPSYLYTFFQSDIYWKQIRADLSGSAQPNFNATKLGNVKLLLPPLEEQKEIVSRIMFFSELTDKIKRHVLVASNRIEKFIQTILAKAFNGELVLTEAELAQKEGRDYETAEQLLARIRAERETQPKQKREVRKTMKEKIGKKKTPPYEARMNRVLETILKTKGKKVTPEQLFKMAGFNEGSMDDFYEELRAAVQAGQIRESRPKKTEIYLEVV